MTTQILPVGGAPLAAIDLGQIEELPALAAAGRILAWRSALASIWNTAEVEVMAACWAIRRHHPDREEFNVFVHATLHGAVPPLLAWRLADLWSIARKHRQTRELALTRPKRATAFMLDVARTLDIERTADGDPDLGVAEREILELVVAPAAKRRAGLERIAAWRSARQSSGRRAGDLSWRNKYPVCGGLGSRESGARARQRSSPFRRPRASSGRGRRGCRDPRARLPPLGRRFR